MQIQEPPLIAELPEAPYVGDPQFNQHADALLSHLGTMRDQVNASNASSYVNALAAKDLASQALSASVLAQQAQAIALGMSNFKGLYEALHGGLNMPASTKHANRIWLLVRNVADVQAEVPGVSDAWSPNDSGQVVTQQITADTQGIAGVKYLIAAPNITLTAPTVWNKGDRFGYQLVVPVNGQQLDFGGVAVMGVARGLVVLNKRRINDDWMFEDNTLGLIAS